MAETISDTRAALTKHVQRFRDQGIDAEPVLFGERRNPEAVLLPYETLELLLGLAEDIAIAQRVRERDAADDGTRTTLTQAADEFDIDPNSL